jgi:15-cis-phytoene synthase
VTDQVSGADLVLSLPVLQRLALSYGPKATRGPLLAFLALDTRLAGIVRGSREPMLAQLRLAWWREQLASDPAGRPGGDPLIAALADWPEGGAGLVTLVDGWEAMTAPAPLPASSIEALANARAGLFAALAGDAEVRANALRLGRNWALADIAAHLGQEAERQMALELVGEQDWRWASLSRNLRPLAVLHGIAARNLAKGRAANHPTPGALLIAIRMGLLGR